MAEYRVPEFTLVERVEVALQMLNPEREWGLVSELARLHDVSRTLLYKIRERGLDSLVESLHPGEAGRPGQVTRLTVNKAFIERTIAILPMLTGSVRDIRLGLDLILGVSRSVGYISQNLTVAGEQAKAYNLGVKVPLPVLGEADEIFQGRKPCLTLVDGRSFLVLNLTPAEARDGTTWGLTYLEFPTRHPVS
jgi:transposase-like protein